MVSFGLKIAVFSTFIFYSIEARKMSFTIFYIEKTPLQPIKTRSLKSRKTDLFPKRLTNSFGPKLAIFPTFFFRYYIPENIFYDILDQKTAFLGHKNKKFKKSKNWHFFKGVSLWFWSKNGVFSNFCFFGQYRPGKSLLRYCTSKNAFVAYKNKKFRKLKNWHFSKGVNP